MLQGVAVRCNVLPCAAVFCSALQESTSRTMRMHGLSVELQRVAVCCNVLQCVVGCSSVWQCSAAFNSVLQCVAAVLEQENARVCV